ncbi:MAG: YkgJ family cysteine cluster protein [Polyangiales bacterium]
MNDVGSHAPRASSRLYVDPVDEIWLATARKLGLRVRRSDAAYASYDGRGELTIATSEHFDADDSLAQIVLHELCHALVSGKDALQSVDWGLSNTDEHDLVREHACHRLQAALSNRYGLRGLFAVTTDHRPYWDALPEDPLAPGDDLAIELAREAWQRARGGAIGEAVHSALAATAKVADAVRPFSGERSLWGDTVALHASGFPLGRDESKRCENCAWMFSAGPGRAVTRCRQTRKGAGSIARRVAPADRACERFEPKLSIDGCGSCGACCREGFDLVPVRPRDAIRKRHPELVRESRHGAFLPRPEGHCVALDGDGDAATPYRCRVYGNRPSACVEFEVGGDACLLARRRVGLSR